MAVSYHKLVWKTDSWHVDNVLVIGETYSCEFSDVGIENDSCAVKILFLRSVAPHMSPGREEKAKGEEKVKFIISSFIHLPFGLKKDVIQTSQSHIPCSRRSQ